MADTEKPLLCVLIHPLQHGRMERMWVVEIKVLLLLEGPHCIRTGLYCAAVMHHHNKIEYKQYYSMFV